jgi:hypothetical protein
MGYNVAWFGGKGKLPKEKRREKREKREDCCIGL